MKKVIIAAALILITGVLSSRTVVTNNTKPIVATQNLLTATVNRDIASAD